MPRLHQSVRVGLGVLAAALYWVGIDVVLAALTHVSTAAVATAILAIVIGTLLGAWNCYRIAELRTTLSFRGFLPVFWRSWAVGITLPGQVGDLVTTLWQLKGRANLEFVAGRLIADKVITLLLTLALLAFVPQAIGAARPETSALILLALVAGTAAVVCCVAWFRRHPQMIDGSRFGKRSLSVLEATAIPPGLAIGNALVTCGKVLASGCAYWAVLKAVAPHAPGFGPITVISQTAGLIAYVPISFNGLGTVELSAVALFGAAGVEAAAVMSTYVALRLITMATAWVPVIAFTLIMSPTTDP